MRPLILLKASSAWEQKFLRDNYPRLLGHVSQDRAELIARAALKALGCKRNVAIRYITREQGDIEMGREVGGWTTDHLWVNPHCTMTFVAVGAVYPDRFDLPMILHECVHAYLGARYGHGKTFKRTLMATFKWLGEANRQSRS